jgi:hypothetical protein
MRSIVALTCCLLFLAVSRIAPLRAESIAEQSLFTDKIPAQVLGAIVLHGAGIGTALLLTDKDLSHKYPELDQDDVFCIYETMYQIEAGSGNADTATWAYGWGKVFRPWLAGILKGSVGEYNSHDIESFGASLETDLRIFLLRKKTWNISYECGFGLCYNDRDFPPGGTKLNFGSVFGLGAMVRLKDGIFWNLGYRHRHISNAGIIAGDDHNPGYDSNGVYSGLVIIR